jgi:hypothetical protein
MVFILGKKTTSLLVVWLFISLLFTSLGTSSYKNTNIVEQVVKTSYEEQDLVLLHGEFYLTLDALESVDSFNVKYVFPLDYQFQVPILLYLLNDSTADILDYKIQTDDDGLNKIVNFTIGHMEKNEKSKIHFSAWALVKNEKFEDLPSNVKIPTKEELPEDTKQWLSSTEVVQVDHPLIKLRAKLLRGFTDDLIKLVKRVTKFTFKHRWGLFYLECKLNFWFSQDALTTLLLSGECVGKSHLGCALLRANGVPARVIYGVPANAGWYASHSMVEYYVPGYGWVFSELPQGYITFEPITRLILRISFPWEENDTISYSRSEKVIGLHRWYWISNENITSGVIGSMMHNTLENEIVTDPDTANETFNFTRTVYKLYEYYTQIDLEGDNLVHFQNAVSYQKDAVFELGESDNLFDYTSFLEKAKYEYEQIIL